MNVFARPKLSRAHNFVYVAFGYLVCSLYVKGFYSLDIQDAILVTVLAGGFIGSILFYLKPELYLIRAIMSVRRRSRRYLAYAYSSEAWGYFMRGLPLSRAYRVSEKDALNSPFLAEDKAYASGALYLSLSVLAVWLILPIPQAFRLVLPVVSLGLLLKFISEVMSLGYRAFILSEYYKYMMHGVPRFEDWTVPHGKSVLEGIRDALNRSDWVEAGAQLVSLDVSVREIYDNFRRKEKETEKLLRGFKRTQKEQTTSNKSG